MAVQPIARAAERGEPTDAGFPGAPAPRARGVTGDLWELRERARRLLEGLTAGPGPGGRGPGEFGATDQQPPPLRLLGGYWEAVPDGSVASALSNEDLGVLAGDLASLSFIVDSLKLVFTQQLLSRTEGLPRAEGLAGLWGFRSPKEALTRLFGAGHTSVNALLNLAEQFGPQELLTRCSDDGVDSALLTALATGRISAEAAAATQRALADPAFTDPWPAAGGRGGDGPGGDTTKDSSSEGGTGAGGPAASAERAARLRIAAEEDLVAMACGLLPSGAGASAGGDRDGNGGRVERPDSDHAETDGRGPGWGPGAPPVGQGGQGGQGGQPSVAELLLAPEDTSGWARRRTITDITRQGSKWATAARPERREEQVEEQFKRRFFRVSPRAGGGYSFSGFAPELHGAMINTLFDAFTTPRAQARPDGVLDPSGEHGDLLPGRTAARDDDRSNDQLRYDVIFALIDQHARSTDAPSQGGGAPTILITTTFETARAENAKTLDALHRLGADGSLDGCGTTHGGPGTRHAGNGGAGRIDGPFGLGPPSREQLRRALDARFAWVDRDDATLPSAYVTQMICNDAIQVLITDPEGQDLYLSKRQRFFTPAQRTILAERDHGCSAPGCDFPPGWCEAHHVFPWGRDGRTDIDNAILLCTYHHGELHRGHYDILSVAAPDGGPPTPSGIEPARGGSWDDGSHGDDVGSRERGSRARVRRRRRWLVVPSAPRGAAAVGTQHCEPGAGDREEAERE